LDGSHLAEAVLPVVERIALALATPVVLLHVIERGARSTIHGDRHFTNPVEAGAYLDDLARSLAARGLRVTAHIHEVPEGDVASSIAGHAEEESADLIVLCTHGSGGVRDLFYGSIAQQVLQRGTTPVLLVRPATGGDSHGAFLPETILVPLDATAASEVALGPATTLARALNARLHLAMVVATPTTMRGGRAAVATLLPSAARTLLDLEVAQAQAYLTVLARDLAAQGLEVEVEVRRGDAAQELAGEAQEHHVGLVVAATHGRAGLQAIWAGSVAARLLGRTQAPVLLVRTIED
jgi:nucleotide-binding universal stress UspA family protein